MFNSFAVVIPAYNCAKTLPATLESIGRSVRSFRSTESSRGVRTQIVVVDDCSSDATQAIALTLCRQIPELISVQTPENRGPGPARNFGVKATSAELLLFCDGDDLFFENHVQVCWQVMAASPDIGAVKTGVYTEDKLHPHFEKVVQTSIPSNLCVRRDCHEFIDGFPEDAVYRELRGGEDTAYILMLSRFFKVQFTGVKTVQYMRYPGNAFDRQLLKFQNPPGAVPEFASDKERKISEAAWQIFEEKYQRLCAKSGSAGR